MSVSQLTKDVRAIRDAKAAKAEAEATIERLTARVIAHGIPAGFAVDGTPVKIVKGDDWNADIDAMRSSLSEALYAASTKVVAVTPTLRTLASHGVPTHVLEGSDGEPVTLPTFVTLKARKPYVK